MDTSAQGLIRLHDRMRQDTSGMFSLWEESARMTQTRKLSALTAAIARTTSVHQSFEPFDAGVVNSVATDCVGIHAAGCMSWILPSDGRWFKFSPQEEFKADAVEEWLDKCTELTLTWLSASNFYTKAHELMMDRVITGTAILTAEQGKRQPLNFRVFDPGSYIIQDDEEGNADMLFRERQLTAKQAVEKFGPDAVSAKILADANGDRPMNLHMFLQAVYRRPDAERQKPGSVGFEWAEKWVEVKEKKEVGESGFQEQPFFGNRYLRWSEFSPWGVSPTMQALAEVRGVNYLDLLQSTQAEVAVSPRLIMPQGYQGVPDLRAGGITMGGLTRDSFPQEWLTGSRLDFADPLIQRKEAVIRAMYHAPLFEQFATIERQITATEVRAREAEKVARFSPAFTQLTTELLYPLLERVFMLLYRQGKLPIPPNEARFMDAGGTVRIAFPRVVHTSRMALAIAALRKSALADAFALFAPLANAGSDVLDNLDTDKAFREVTRADGIGDFLKGEDARDEFRQQRAEAQQAAEQQAAMQELLKSNPIAEAGVDALRNAA